MKPDWYVIIGGPCSGKTTTINELGRRGFHIVPEAATSIISEWISEGKKVQDLRRDENIFTKLIFKRKLENEANAPEKGVVFFDRGIPDAVAYDRNYGAKTSEEIIKLCLNRKYKKVFFLENVPYKQSESRSENSKTAEKLSKLLLETYQEFGYPVIFVPLMPIQRRVSFILEKIKE